jgi:hypothetical protein
MAYDTVRGSHIEGHKKHTRTATVRSKNLWASHRCISCIQALLSYAKSHG